MRRCDTGKPEGLQCCLWNPGAVETLRDAPWKLNASNRPGADALRIENHQIAGVARAVVNKADEPALVLASPRSRRHGKLARRPAFPKIVVLGLPAFQIIAQETAKGAAFEIAIVCERIDDRVRPSGVAIVDARELSCGSRIDRHDEA